MTFKAALLVLAFSATCLATENAPAENAARNLYPENQSITIGYSGFMSAVSLVLVVVAIAAVVALLAAGTSEAAGYEAPIEYASAPGPAAYEKVYSVLNSLKEAARKYQ
ncbi:uncharacterized protein LOC125031391 [Penaeus chinensis]|uniref:uncharacterized protein LOC125031391 n=1 Tax=Penaeus chinensis TaxID=139456 RepID=UPI001FB857F3|nr:uncharacterized protein LOC125031391 [Penaeus chinensis]